MNESPGTGTLRKDRRQTGLQLSRRSSWTVPCGTPALASAYKPSNSMEDTYMHKAIQGVASKATKATGGNAKPKTKIKRARVNDAKFSLRLPRQMLGRLQVAARSNKLCASDYVRVLMAEFIDFQNSMGKPNDH